jgi:hypothetical protein
MSIESEKVGRQRPLSEAEQKRRFLLFIKILFKALDQAGNCETRERAKVIVSDCTRQNRLGDPNYTPLMDAIDRRLRDQVGEVHWRRANIYMQHYMNREARGRRMTSVLSPILPIVRQTEEV